MFPDFNKVFGWNKEVAKGEESTSMGSLVWNETHEGTRYVDVMPGADGEDDFGTLAVRFGALRGDIARENEKENKKDAEWLGSNGRPMKDDWEVVDDPNAWADVMKEIDTETRCVLQAEVVRRKWAAHLADNRAKRLEVVRIKLRAEEDGQRWMASRRKLQEVSEELAQKIAKANEVRAAKVARAAPVQPAQENVLARRLAVDEVNKYIATMDAMDAKKGV